MTVSRSIHVSANGTIPFLFMKGIHMYLSTYEPHLLYSFLCSWTFNLLPCPCCRCSAAKLCPTFWPHELQHARLPCPSLSSWVCSTHVHWVSDAIQPSHPLSPSSLALKLSQHQGLFQCWHFASGGQSIGFSASASVRPMNIQGWFPLGLNDWISLLSKELSSLL